MRHGRKSKQFNGYKRHIATDLDTDLILACTVTPANRPEEEAARRWRRGHLQAMGSTQRQAFHQEVDAILFEQMLANLILNAADAAGKNGLIRVVLTQENGKARLEVHDNGPGVPPEKRENIFKAFETTKPDGLGVGLLSVRIAVQVQGGTCDYRFPP